MSIRDCLPGNNLQQKAKGCVVVNSKKRSREIKVNLYFNDGGESLQRIIERNLRILAGKAAR
jgi:hypothetical protein